MVRIVLTTEQPAARGKRKATAGSDQRELKTVHISGAVLSLRSKYFKTKVDGWMEQQQAQQPATKR